ISDKVHIINQYLSEKEWCQLRTISLTALKKAEFIDHGVNTGMDRSPAISVKLADEEQDLKITCKADSTRVEKEIIKNDDREVEYKVLFKPPLKPGETIV